MILGQSCEVDFKRLAQRSLRRIVHTGPINELAGPWVTDIEVRSDGLVAVTSVEWLEKGGVSLFDGSHWTTYTTTNSPLPHRQVEAVGFDAAGHLWVGATSEGVAQVFIGEPGNCPWDLDKSGSVGTGDLLALFAQWGTDGSADFDGSGAVGTSDLLILFANWGPCK